MSVMYNVIVKLIESTALITVNTVNNSYITHLIF